jgi:hypothetical protein
MTQSLEEYDDDALAEMADAWAKEAEHLGRLARGAHEELRARMLESGATKLDTPHWEGTLKPGTIRHTVDDVRRLLNRFDNCELLSEQDIQDAFTEDPPPPLRANHAVLNDLHKRGGEIARIIDEERKSVRGDSTLILTRKVDK